MNIEYNKYYDLENYVLTEVRESFNKKGYLTAFDFFCIVIWKANRAKSKIAKTLLKLHPDIEVSVRNLTSSIFKAQTTKEKFEILHNAKFRLPMASAILSLLYPNEFTVFDIRVCETFPEFKGLEATTNFEKLWSGYSKFIDSVKMFEPRNLSLRDKDRYLWGKSFHQQLTNHIKTKFEK